MQHPPIIAGFAGGADTDGTHLTLAVQIHLAETVKAQPAHQVDAPGRYAEMPRPGLGGRCQCRTQQA